LLSDSDNESWSIQSKAGDCDYGNSTVEFDSAFGDPTGRLVSDNPDLNCVAASSSSTNNGNVNDGATTDKRMLSAEWQSLTPSSPNELEDNYIFDVFVTSNNIGPTKRRRLPAVSYRYPSPNSVAVVEPYYYQEGLAKQNGS
jgi:hypothetical protein